MVLLFRVFFWDSEVYVVLFVYRVLGLFKGLYFLVRNEDYFDDFKKVMRLEFLWRKLEGCFDEFFFYEFVFGDCRDILKFFLCY